MFWKRERVEFFFFFFFQFFFSPWNEIIHRPYWLHLVVEAGGGDDDEALYLALTLTMIVVVVVVVVVVDASSSSSHSWSLLLWTEDHEPHEGRASQLLPQKGWPQASLHFPQKLPLDDLWGHQGYPMLALEGMDMAPEG